MKSQLMARDNLRVAVRLSGSPAMWGLFKSARNKCVKMLINCKKDYYQKIFSNLEQEKDSKNIYRMTNELLDSRSGSTPQSFFINGKLIRKPIDMANAQMSYYKEKIQDLISNIPVSLRNPHRFLDAALDSWEQKDEHQFF